MRFLSLWFFFLFFFLRFANIEIKSVKFEDSLFENCYFEDVKSTNTFFENCTIKNTVFYNTGSIIFNQSNTFLVFFCLASNAMCFLSRPVAGKVQKLSNGKHHLPPSKERLSSKLPGGERHSNLSGQLPGKLGCAAWQHHLGTFHGQDRKDPNNR